MLIEQQVFFNGLGFEEYEFQYATGRRKCFKGPDGCYYRVDHFRDTYVIEYAPSESEARLNRFEDADLYDDSLPVNELVSLVQSDLKKYVA